MYDEHKEYVDERFTQLWKQIARYFNKYDEKLIFEAFNEPAMYDEETGGFGQWTYDFIECQIRRVDELNELFIETIRATGSNNTDRFLLIGGADWNHPLQNGSFLRMAIPDDPNIIAGVHFYSFKPFTLDAYAYPVEFIDEVFDTLDEFKEKTGVPVIVGEWGMMKMDSFEVRSESMQYFTERAKQSGIPCIYFEYIRPYPWVLQGDFSTEFGFYNWLEHDWLPEELPILQGLMRIIHSDYDLLVEERKPIIDVGN